MAFVKEWKVIMAWARWPGTWDDFKIFMGGDILDGAPMIKAYQIRNKK